MDEVGVAGLAERWRSASVTCTACWSHESVPGRWRSLGRAARRPLGLLLEQTDLSVTDVGFAAGFASLRQFNDVMRAEYGASPTERSGVTPHARTGPPTPGSVALRLPVTRAVGRRRLLAFLGARADPWSRVVRRTGRYVAR